MHQPPKVKYDEHMNIVDVPKPKANRKPVAVYNEPYSITKMKLDRERLILSENYTDETAAYILALEMQLNGVRSAPKRGEITTTQEIKDKQASRFKEDNDVAAWGKWFKEQYPGIPYTIDKVAQHRSSFGGAIHKSSAYQSGNPDICIQTPRAGFSGAYIEQKRDDSIFYKGTKILKPGSENHNIWQSLYQADLREQGYWIMFSISLEATKKITERYMAGNPYKQVVFEYYCKPEDYPIFEGHKHFKPIKNKP